MWEPKFVIAYYKNIKKYLNAQFYLSRNLVSQLVNVTVAQRILGILFFTLLYKIEFSKLIWIMVSLPLNWFVKVR